MAARCCTEGLEEKKTCAACGGAWRFGRAAGMPHQQQAGCGGGSDAWLAQPATLAASWRSSQQAAAHNQPAAPPPHMSSHPPPAKPRSLPSCPPRHPAPPCRTLYCGMVASEKSRTSCRTFSLVGAMKYTPTSCGSGSRRLEMSSTTGGGQGGQGAQAEWHACQAACPWSPRRLPCQGARLRAGPPSPAAPRRPAQQRPTRSREEQAAAPPPCAAPQALTRHAIVHDVGHTRHVGQHLRWGGGGAGLGTAARLQSRQRSPAANSKSSGMCPAQRQPPWWWWGRAPARSRRRQQHPVRTPASHPAATRSTRAGRVGAAAAYRRLPPPAAHPAAGCTEGRRHGCSYTSEPISPAAAAGEALARRGPLAGLRRAACDAPAAAAWSPGTAACPLRSLPSFLKRCGKVCSPVQPLVGRALTACPDGFKWRSPGAPATAIIRLQLQSHQSPAGACMGFGTASQPSQPVIHRTRHSQCIGRQPWSPAPHCARRHLRQPSCAALRPCLRCRGRWARPAAHAAGRQRRSCSGWWRRGGYRQPLPAAAAAASRARQQVCDGLVVQRWAPLASRTTRSERDHAPGPAPAGEQPAPGSGGPEGSSLLGSLGLWALWAALAGYAFLVAPNQTPLRDSYFLEKLVGLVRH